MLRTPNSVSRVRGVFFLMWPQNHHSRLIHEVCHEPHLLKMLPHRTFASSLSAAPPSRAAVAFSEQFRSFHFSVLPHKFPRHWVTESITVSRAHYRLVKMSGGCELRVGKLITLTRSVES